MGRSRSADCLGSCEELARRTEGAARHTDDTTIAPLVRRGEGGRSNVADLITAMRSARPMADRPLLHQLHLLIRIRVSSRGRSSSAVALSSREMKLPTSMAGSLWVANSDPMPSSIGGESLSELFLRGLLLPWDPTRRGRWSSGTAASGGQPAAANPPEGRPRSAPRRARSRWRAWDERTLRLSGEVAAMLVVATDMYEDSFPTGIRSGLPTDQGAHLVRRPRRPWSLPVAAAFAAIATRLIPQRRGNAESALLLPASRRLRPFPAAMARPLTRSP